MGFKGCRKHFNKRYRKPSRSSPNVPSALVGELLELLIFAHYSHCVRRPSIFTWTFIYCHSRVAVAQGIAACYGISVEEVEQITASNAEKVFNLPQTSSLHL